MSGMNYAQRDVTSSSVDVKMEGSGLGNTSCLFEDAERAEAMFLCSCPYVIVPHRGALDVIRSSGNHHSATQATQAT